MIDPHKSNMGAIDSTMRGEIDGMTGPVRMEIEFSSTSEVALDST